MPYLLNKSQLRYRLIWRLMRRLRNCSLTAARVLCSAEVTHAGWKERRRRRRRRRATGTSSRWGEQSPRGMLRPRYINRTDSVPRMRNVPRLNSPRIPCFCLERYAIESKPSTKHWNVSPRSGQPVAGRSLPEPCSVELFSRIHWNGTTPALARRTALVKLEFWRVYPQSTKKMKGNFVIRITLKWDTRHVIDALNTTSQWNTNWRVATL